ncbi:sensor histidine kinase [Aeromicrobium phragmitis]|nr:histidine kinase [Aeromicrobium phragmitis]
MSPTEPRSAENRSGRRRDSFTMTWRYNLVSLWMYLGFGSLGAVANALLRDDLVGWRRVVVLLLIIALMGWAGYWCRSLIVGRSRHGMPALVHGVTAVAATLLVVIASWHPGAPIGYLLVPWSAIAVLGLDFRRGEYLAWLLAWAAALLGLRALVVVVSGGDLAGFFPNDFGSIYLLAFFAVFVPAASWFQLWIWELTIDVRDAGVTRAELTRVRERLRFAADLHDIQGHHLQVLALKTELAERLIDRDPELARATIHEAQEIARTALEETRTLAQGYRQVSLHDEIVNAASVLEASGAMVRVDVPAQLDHPLLATALREATTNILRHSNATTVEISGTLDPPSLRVVNDGVIAPPNGSGTGLASLAERFAARGGSVESQRAEDRFTLVATAGGPT